MTCPHCSAPNAAGDQFCESCGKALPGASSAGPRIVDEKSFASTAAGQKLQSEDLRKQLKKAANALLAVAIIQTVVCGILVGIASGTNHLDTFLRNGIFLGIAVCAVIFWAVYFWARTQPFPAAIVGLVFYATLLTINVVRSVGQLASGHGTGIGGIGIGWLDIVILAVLAQAISAGSKYRKMMQTGI